MNKPKNVLLALSLEYVSNKNKKLFEITREELKILIEESLEIHKVLLNHGDNNE
jgi:hypothetical protein